MSISEVSGYQRLEALAYRDRLTRFSGGSVGPYWAQLTPLIWIAFLVVLFDVLGRVPPIHAHSAIFVATGVLPYILFRQSITSLARSVIANRHLRYIVPIGHNEILLASSCVEGWNTLLTSSLIFGFLLLVGFADPPAGPQAVILSLLLLFFLFSSIGRLIAVIGLMSDSVARFYPIALRPFFWISGVFYTATELPRSVQELLWWNPLFHVTEGLREGYFQSYVSPVFMPIYPLVCACLIFLLSLTLEKFVLQNIQQRYRL